MKPITTLFTCLLGISLTMAAQTSKSAAKPGAKPSAGGVVAQDYRQIPKRPLPPFKPQQPLRIQLENGMVIFLQEDHELPFIGGTMRIRGGGRDVAPEKTGMLGIYAETWRTGGTKDKTGDELDEYLESRAASVEAGASVDSTSLSFSSLKKDFDDVFGVFLAVLREPVFRQEKIDLEKRQTKSAISRRNDDVGEIVGREVAKLAYGKGSPYARQAEYWTIDAITRDDLVAWHKQHVHPNNIILGVAGDFDPKAMEARLRKEFESWPKGATAPKPEVEFKDPKPGVYFVEKEDVNQSSISLLTLGIKRDNPDYYAIQVMNELFGQSSASRLYVNIRTRQGLAYAIGGGIGSSYDYPGVFRLGMGTKSSTTVDAIHALYREIEELRKNPGSADEVKKAKDNILNSFIFNFDSKVKVLQEKMRYEFYGFPLDTLDRFRSEIEKVTPADVARVVKKYVDRDRFAILVVGKSAEFGKPLSQFGQVQPIDITIQATPTTPDAGRAEPESGIETNAQGRALMQKVLQVVGGNGKIAAVKSLRQTMVQTLKLPQGDVALDVTVTVAYPDHLHVSMQTPVGEMVRVLSPSVAYASRNGQVQELPANMKADQLRDLKRDMLSVLQHVDDPKYHFAARDKVGEATAIDVDADGVVAKWFVDDSGHILKSQFTTSTQEGPVHREIEFSDYRDAEGLSLPHARVTRDNGDVVSQIQIKEIRLNPTVDPKLFEKP